MGKKRTAKHKRDDADVIPIDDDGKELARVKKLKGELAECLLERKEYLDGWQRAKADLVNSRNSLERDYREKIRHAGEEVLMELIPTLDNFDMAFSDTALWESVSPEWRKGMEHIHAQLLATLAKYNIEPLDPTGAAFDPELHESLESIIVDKKEKDGMIMNVLLKGYTLNGKLIRAARVVVGSHQH